MDVKDKVAMYWRLEQNGSIVCELCPHFCKIKTGQMGLCNVRYNAENVLYASNYGKIVSYAYDPIEKKPLNHFYPGSTIFSIGTFGCNLACRFCQNHELVAFNGLVTPAFDEQVLELAAQNGSIGIAFTYNEPTVWYEYVLDMSKKAHEKGLKTVLVTNGYINEAPLLELLPYIDAMNIDLKSMTNSFYESICGGTLSPVLRTIEICAKYTHVEITNLLIDGLNADQDELEAMCRWLAAINANIPLHISRYFPAHLLDVPKTRLETLALACDIAEKHLTNVSIGNAFI